MISSKLELPALLGGEKSINKNFSPYNSIGKEEIKIASKIVKSGKLS